LAPVAGSIGKALRWFCICDLRLENPLMAGSFRPPGMRVVIDSGSRLKTAAPNSVWPVTIWQIFWGFCVLYAPGMGFEK
jgi:hypothetical protein